MSMKIYLYSGTHWDREWYQTFQGFRHRLVEMADKLVDGLETTPEYGVFHFDGQTIVLEDILEIAPDLKDRLAALIREGRIIIGPWYCMPDEYIISGESLIRNLQIGKEICHKWGVEPSGEGYICDIFGHIAQMPQIFDGMNIHHAVLGRGTNEHNTPMHFRWQAPDGTDVRTFKLSDPHGYSDFTSNGVHSTDPAPGMTAEEMMERIGEYAKERADAANIPVVMFLDAHDHNQWHRETPVYVEALKRLFPDAEVYHTDVMDMCREVDRYMDQLPVKAGELNETSKLPGGYVHLITNVLSSRYPIKKANDTIQTALEKVVQPLYAYRKVRSRDGFLALAQKYLIQNHPHDSICGCSIDQVHRDMMYRFDQARLLIEEIMDRVTDDIYAGSFTEPICAREDGRDSMVIRLYNPLPYRIHRMVEAKVRFSKKFGKYWEPFGYEGICSFKLYDADGNEVPYGITDIETRGGEDFYTITLEADLAASTLTEYEVRYSEKPSRYLEKLSKDTYTAENGDIILAVSSADGTVSITDRKTGMTYSGLLALLDDGEIGDGWFHCNPATDRTVFGSFVSVEKCENNINSVSFRINMNLRLPKDVDRSHFGIRRNEEYVDVPVSHTVTLYRTERYVKVKTVVDNKAMDHRLKLRLPTGIAGETYQAGQAFAFVERKTDSDPDTADWKETAVAEKATDGIVLKKNERGGFAFISRYGLHECAVYGNGNMDITLLRCYRKTVGTDGEPDGQLVGVHEFEYLLCPVDSDTAPAALAKLRDTFAADVTVVSTTGKTGRKYGGGLEIADGTFVFSTANKLADGFEFRIYNCSDEEETGEITLPAGSSSAELTHIDGRHIADVPVCDGKIRLTLGKWKIATVKVC